MDNSRAIRLTFGNAIRVVHIALWLTIPTVFWLWLLLAELPAECVPEYGWYRGNVLCVSEDTYFFIMFGTFLLGFIVITLWITGYILEAIGRVARGDTRLPPVRLSVIGKGCGFLWSSLKYWLPAIAAAVFGHTILSRLSHEISSHGVATLLLIAAPVTLVMCWGHLVGAARYAADGDRSLVCRRRENMRLALKNIKSTLALSMLLFLLTKLVAVLWSGLYDLSIPMKDLDPYVVAALGAFVFYCVIICWSIACSRLIARYAKQIGVCDHLKSGAKPG